ncbi:hypothetical protein ACOTVD_09555 [Campylobacter jejuni]|uniref:hypothetical protein n=1 Tax=Campylobacter jejuni TaxID=197 RepID=UPI003B9D07E6
MNSKKLRILMSSAESYDLRRENIHPLLRVFNPYGVYSFQKFESNFCFGKEYNIPQSITEVDILEKQVYEAKQNFEKALEALKTQHSMSDEAYRNLTQQILKCLKKEEYKELDFITFIISKKDIEILAGLKEKHLIAEKQLSNYKENNKGE